MKLTPITSAMKIAYLKFHFIMKPQIPEDAVITPELHNLYINDLVLRTSLPRERLVLLTKYLETLPASVHHMFGEPVVQIPAAVSSIHVVPVVPVPPTPVVDGDDDGDVEGDGEDTTSTTTEAEPEPEPEPEPVVNVGGSLEPSETNVQDAGDGGDPVETEVSTSTKPSKKKGK